MKSPKVSVLIPTFNYARYLPEAIDSVLEQDFQDYEILIFDDNSSDETRPVLERYAALDRRIRFQVNSPARGMVPNWNLCLESAQGQYLKYVFGDDKLSSPRALRTFVEMLDANDSVALAASARTVIDENSKVIDLWDCFGQTGVYKGTDAILRCLEGNGNLIGEPSVAIFRKHQAARGFDPRYRQIVDLEMWFHLLEQGDLAYTRTPLCSFRQHGRQQSALNFVNGVGQQETVVLLEECLTKPWMRQRSSRKLLFKQIYSLRKHRTRGVDTRHLEITLKNTLGTGWYAAYWTAHKLTTPFSNLKRSVQKRLLRKPAR